jgi:type IV pilus assembly protein PilV
MNRTQLPQGGLPESGFSLIEVMISLVIIAVGLLGIAGIMALSMNNDDTSRLQSLAALQAASMATAMQANTAYWTSTAANGTRTAPTTSSTACNGVVCSAASIANCDLANWGYAIDQSLPNGSGTVTCAAAARPNSSSPAATTCSITIGWNTNNMANDHQSTTAATVSPQSYVLVVQP